MGISVFIGSDYEKETLQNLSILVDQCEEYGIPVMAVTAVGKELEKKNVPLPGALLPHSRRTGGKDS